MHRSERLPRVLRRVSVVFFGVCGLLSFGAVHASPEGPIGLERIGAGELLWKSDQGLVPLPMADVDVRLSVNGILLHGVVTQSFRNPHDETIEVLYAFPLPDRAAVHRMEMTIGERRIRSVIREREAARRAYETAKASGKKAALLDQKRPNLFITSAANIDPGEKIEVRLEYLEELVYEDGSFLLRFPLVFVPRYCPPDRAEEAPAEDAITTALVVPHARSAAPAARIEVELDPGVAIDALESPSHGLSIEGVPGGRYRVLASVERADRDFVLRWRPRLGHVPQAAVFVEQHAAGRFALAMLLPPIRGSEAGLGLPTETLFIIDVSSSMQGPSIEQARTALLAALDRLRPEDRFNILRFNDGNGTFRDGFQQAEGEPLDAARDWVGSLRATGGTAILPALVRGLELMGRSRSSRAQRIVFLTDGAVGNEEELYRAITERLGDVRLHAIGIGNAPNAHLMRKIAWFGRGMCEFVDSTERATGAIDRFFERLERPVLTDPELDWHGLAVEERYPGRLPDLHAGQPLLVYARLADGGSGGRLSVSGHTRAGWIESSAELPALAVEGAGIATRWARARVEGLLDGLAEGDDPQRVREEVVDLALDFELVTPYTSLVAVEESVPSRGTSARPIRLAAALPLGGTDDRVRLLSGLALAGIGLALLFGCAVWRP